EPPRSATPAENGEPAPTPPDAAVREARPQPQPAAEAPKSPIGIPKAVPVPPVSAVAVAHPVLHGRDVVRIAVAAGGRVIEITVVAAEVAVITIAVEAAVLVVEDARIAVIGGVRPPEGAVELAVELGRDRRIGLVGQVVLALGRLVGDPGGGEEGAAILEGAVPVAVLEDPAVGLADPLGGHPRPPRLHLGPEAFLPDHAVAVGVVLPGDVEG